MWEKIKIKIVFPKLILFVLCLGLAYIFLQANVFDAIAEKLNHHGYASVFLAGCLFSYGFTTPFAIGMFLSIGDHVNFWYAAPLAALGSTFSDLLIFSWIHMSFQDEFNRVKLLWPFKKISHFLRSDFNYTVRKYLTYAFAGLIIASPFPDEFGVSLLSGFSKIDKVSFLVISYLCNVVGIAIFLALS